MAAILIVEDDSLICELVGMLLEDLGYAILSATDVDGALVFLRSSRRIDALFTDIHLKKITFGGCSVAHKAVELRPNLRVLYTTGNAITGELKSQLIAGATLLRKPYTNNQLADSIKLLLAA